MLKKQKRRMMVWMSRRMIACDEAAFLVSYRQDHGLNMYQKMQLKLHLMACHLCRKYDRQIRQLSVAVHRYSEQCNDPACTHHLSKKQCQQIGHVLAEEIKKS